MLLKPFAVFKLAMASLVAAARVERLRNDLRRFDHAASPLSASSSTAFSASSAFPQQQQQQTSIDAWGLPERPGAALADETAALIDACCRPGLNDAEARDSADKIKVAVEHARMRVRREGRAHEGDGARGPRNETA